MNWWTFYLLLTALFGAGYIWGSADTEQPAPVPVKIQDDNRTP